MSLIRASNAVSGVNVSVSMCDVLYECKRSMYENAVSGVSVSVTMCDVLYECQRSVCESGQWCQMEKSDNRQREHEKMRKERKARDVTRSIHAHCVR